MSRRILTAFLLVILILTIVKFSRTSTASAAGQEVFGACVSQIPQGWGQFKGGSEQSGLAFEDGHGTLRFVLSFPCNGSIPPVALEVRRTPGN